MKIYRSLRCSRDGGYPLKKVEVIETDGEKLNNFICIIYDVGFEPPYWDVTNIPPMLMIGLNHPFS